MATLVPWPGDKNSLFLLGMVVVDTEEEDGTILIMDRWIVVESVALEWVMH